MTTSELKTTPPTSPADVPDWVDDTPRDFDYDLLVYDEVCGDKQHIALTRDEYIALKKHLAGMRGYVQAGAPTPIVETVSTDRHELWAARVKTARDAIARGVPLLTEAEVVHLASALKVIQYDDSPAHPVECFAARIIECYTADKLTPASAAEDVDSFTRNFEEMRSAARKFLDKYPAA